MSNTIIFEKRAIDEHFSIDEINQYFAHLANVINGKVDRWAPELTGSLQMNFNGVINVADGVASTDAMTVAQARALIAGA